MMDLQKLVDVMNEQSRHTRGQYQLTLGALIKRLESANPGFLVECSNGKAPGRLSSYRGYYSDLAFEPEEKQTTVEAVLAACKEVLDTTLVGYKGGDFVMGADTPLWLSPWGESSDIALMDVAEGDGKLIVFVKELADG